MSSGPDGLAVVDKESGWTSHDVVARARGILGTRKIGHSGTLDPDATGVLLLGVGRVTRLLRFFLALPKSYSGEVVLGTETDTLDAAGKVTATWDMAGVTESDARAATLGFVGEIEQVPPMVSAPKVGGRRLHDLARAGVEVDRPARKVTVSRFDVVGMSAPGVIGIDVECSSGTYVRSLAADWGRALGGGAHLRELRRTAIGPFTLHEARPLEAIQLITPAEAMSFLVKVSVDESEEKLVSHGAKLPGVDFPGLGPWAVVSAASGKLLAVYEVDARHGAPPKPAVVL